MRAFSSCGEQGLLSSCSAQASHYCGFSCWRAWGLGHGLSSRSAWAKLLCSMWDLPRTGMEPKSPALAGRFLTTGPPGKSYTITFEYTMAYLPPKIWLPFVTIQLNPFTHFTLPRSLSLLVIASLFSVSYVFVFVLFILLFYVPYMNEIIQYFFLSDLFH